MNIQTIQHLTEQAAAHARDRGPKIEVSQAELRVLSVLSHIGLAYLTGQIGVLQNNPKDCGMGDARAKFLYLVAMHGGVAGITDFAYAATGVVGAIDERLAEIKP